MSAQRASRWAAVLEGQRAPSRARRTVPLAAASAAAIGPRTPVLPCTTCVPPRSLSGGERACWGPPQHAHKSLEKKEQGLGPPKIYWRFDRNPCRSLKTLGNRRTRLVLRVRKLYFERGYELVARPYDMYPGSHRQAWRGRARPFRRVTRSSNLRQIPRFWVGTRVKAGKRCQLSAEEDS